MTTTQSSRQRLLDHILGDAGPLSRYVSERRAERRSWRLIARDLYEQTGEDVTYETLRAWFPDEVKAS